MYVLVFYTIRRSTLYSCTRSIIVLRIGLLIEKPQNDSNDLHVDAFVDMPCFFLYKSVLGILRHSGGVHSNNRTNSLRQYNICHLLNDRYASWVLKCDSSKTTLSLLIGCNAHDRYHNAHVCVSFLENQSISTRVSVQVPDCIEYCDIRVNFHFNHNPKLSCFSTSIIEFL